MPHSDPDMTSNILWPRKSLPIIGDLSVEIDPSEQERLSDMALSLVEAEPALGNHHIFAPGVSAGISSGPALFIEDHRRIALTLKGTPDLYDYRISMLAEDGDHLVIGGPYNEDFESYRQNVLGLGPLEVHRINTFSRQDCSLAKICMEEQPLSEQLCDTARQSGSFTIFPYQGKGSIWALAGWIAKETGVPISVVSPPPELARLVNDKIWFAQRVIDVLGPQARPALYTAHGATALTSKVIALARKAEDIIIKHPRSSGSAGNFRIDVATCRTLGAKALHQHLLDLLHRGGWQEQYPLLIEVWDDQVISNPSIQFWIPEAADGLPVIEGLFEQLIEDRVGTFIGATPANLPEPWCQRFAGEAARLAFLFQQLGYYGRCSFDAVLFGKNYASAELHWIECNGRWGAVSIPMTLAGRLMKDEAKLPFIVIHRKNMNFRRQRFGEALDKISELLFRPGKTREGVVLLTPAVIERGCGVHLMAIGLTSETAKSLAQKAFKLLTKD